MKLKLGNQLLTTACTFNLLMPTGSYALPDSDDPSTLYVGPRNIQEIVDNYSELESSGPDCASLASIRSQTYRVPEKEQIDDALKNDDCFYSNYFEVTVRFPWEVRNEINEIKELAKRISFANEENKGIITEYLSKKEIWDSTNMDIAHWEKIRNQATTVYTTTVGICTLDPEHIRSCDDAVKDMLAEQDESNAKLELLYASRDEQRLPYAKAKSDYEAFQIRHRGFTSNLDFVKKALDYARKITQDAFELERKILAAEEDKIVGRATAGSNLFTDEITQESSDEVFEGIIAQFPNLQPEIEAYREISERNQRLLSEYKDLVKSRNNMIRQREVIPDHIKDELEDRKMALLDHAKAMGLEARGLRQKIFIEMRNR